MNGWVIFMGLVSVICSFIGATEKVQGDRYGAFGTSVFFALLAGLSWSS